MRTNCGDALASAPGACGSSEVQAVCAVGVEREVDVVTPNNAGANNANGTSDTELLRIKQEHINTGGVWDADEEILIQDFQGKLQTLRRKKAEAVTPASGANDLPKDHQGKLLLKTDDSGCIILSPRSTDAVKPADNINALGNAAEKGVSNASGQKQPAPDGAAEEPLDPFAQAAISALHSRN